MAKQVTITDTLNLIPNGNTGSTNISATNVSNGYNGVSNTSSYARLQLSASSTSTDCYLYYTFSVSGIPSGATITNVSCVARVYLSRVSNASLQLYSNTTAKGSATSFSNTSASNVTLTNTGSWTISDLNNLRLRITGRRNNTNQNSYIYFYGSDVSITYAYNNTAYEITASSTTQEATVSPASQDVLSGDSCVIIVNTNDLNEIMVKDNGADVTQYLTYIVPSSGTQTFTSIPTSFDSVNSVYNTTAGDSGNGIYSTNYIENGLTNHNSSTRCALYTIQGSGSVSYMYYNFDCSTIPNNATITSVSCQFKGGTQGSSYYSSYVAQLTTGTTLKGSSVSVTGSNSSPTTVTINGGSSWTRAELNNIKIKFQVTRGSSNTTTDSTFSFFGATLTVQYTLPQTPYYEYALTNVNADHSVVVSDYVFIPDEEDPQKTYYSLTISSINASTTPGRGTTRIESGTSETIYIYPTDPLVTLITDNGVDVSNQLVQHGSPISDPTVSSVSGASYGFTLNTSTGYYVSNNTGVDKSAALCRVDFDLPVRCLVTINYINYAEATYDFGVFGNIDTTLSTSYYAAANGGATITDSSYKLACNTSAYNTSSVQTLTYEIPSGEHQVYIKYTKDDATSSNNDTLQWKIASIEPLETNNYYTYTLSNINQDHSLIFIFGEVSYYFVNSSTTSDCKLNPSGSMVQLPGDSYKLTIAPNNITDIITITDNNTNVTNSLERKDIVITKDGVDTTIVNYIYKINNINATHTLVVSVSSGSLPTFIKYGNSWRSGTILQKDSGVWGSIEYTKLYVKQNGTWVEGANTSSSTTAIVFGGEFNNGE